MCTSKDADPDLRHSHKFDVWEEEEGSIISSTGSTRFNIGQTSGGTCVPLCLFFSYFLFSPVTDHVTQSFFSLLLLPLLFFSFCCPRSHSSSARLFLTGSSKQLASLHPHPTTTNPSPLLVLLLSAPPPPCRIFARPDLPPSPLLPSPLFTSSS